MGIDLNKIEIIFNLIIDKLKKDGIHKISLDDDFYWNIPSDLLYDPYNKPNQFDMGQLSEDYDFLLNSIEKNIIINGDLRKLSYLLRYIADKLDQ